jgi:hypothetical protein
MSTREIAKSLNELSSVEDVAQLKLLESLLAELNPSSLTAEQYRALFGLFERFPTHDGHGIFWSIVHLLEKSSRYESFLLESVRRQSAEFNLLMVARFINGGFTQIGDVNLPELLKTVSTSPNASESARAWAREFIR